MGDDPGFPYRIEISFMATTEVDELLKELLQGFREFYCNDNQGEIDAFHEEKPMVKDKADTVWETLNSMFKSQCRLFHKFLSKKREGKRARRSGEAAVMGGTLILRSRLQLVPKRD